MIIDNVLKFKLKYQSMSSMIYLNFCPRLSDWVLVGSTTREGSDKNLLINQIEQLRRLNLITNQISTATNCKKIIERQKQIYPSVFLRLTSDMDTDAPRIDERKRMRVFSPVPAHQPLH